MQQYPHEYIHMSLYSCYSGHKMSEQHLHAVSYQYRLDLFLQMILVQVP